MVTKLDVKPQKLILREIILNAASLGEISKRPEIKVVLHKSTSPGRL